MYLPDCYSMRFTTLSNYYLIDWWCNFEFCLFACWIEFRFCYSFMTWETGGLELASTIVLVLQVNRLTKCASHVLFLVFPHLYWIRRDMKYLSIFSLNAGKYGPEILRIRTLFIQCYLPRLALNDFSTLFFNSILGAVYMGSGKG